MKKHYMDIVKKSDEVTKQHLEKMMGGRMKNHEDLMVHPGTSTGALLTLCASYYCKESDHHHNRSVLEKMNETLDFAFDIQRSDGTFDLVISNFRSAPDTGFIMHNLARCYKIMTEHANSKDEKNVKERLKALIDKAAQGLCHGGFHTPNHRWVVTAGLWLAYQILGQEHLIQMAKRYLAEGIDIDEYGEYTERSTGIYNYVNDNALILIAQESGDEQLYEYVKRNLDMMLTYIDPDGSVFTQNSVRVDKGEGDTQKTFYPANYYHLYLEMAYLTNNSEYAYFADQIHESITQNGMGAQNILWLYMVHPKLQKYQPEMKAIDWDYEVFYKKSNIVRKRKGDVSITLLAGKSPTFLFVQRGSLRCFVRMCGSFFAKGQFRPETISKTQNGYQMKYQAKADYRMPFEQAPNTSEWEKMDHKKRKTVNHLTYEYIVDFTITDEEMVFDVKTQGCDRVPFKMEFCFTGGARIQNDAFMINGTPGHSMVVGKNDITASNGHNEIIVGPAFMEHCYTDEMRGSVPKSQTDFTVNFTGYSPIDKKITIKTR